MIKDTYREKVGVSEGGSVGSDPVLQISTSCVVSHTLQVDIHTHCTWYVLTERRLDFPMEVQLAAIRSYFESSL